MCVDGPLYAHPVDMAEGVDRPVRARQLAAGQAGYGLADVARHATPHQTHFETSFLELNGNLCRGEQYLADVAHHVTKRILNPSFLS